MRITSKKTKTGATISIRADSKADKSALTKAVLSGELMRALNGPEKRCPDCDGTGIEHSGVCHCGEEMSADGPFAHSGHGATEMTRPCESCKGGRA